MPFSITHFLLGSLIITVFVILLISLVLFISPDRWFFSAVVLVFLVTLLFWFEGNIFVIEYGSLNGQEIEWEKYRLIQFIDILIWICALIIGFSIRKKIIRYIPIMCIGLIVIQLGGIGFLLMESQISGNNLPEVNLPDREDPELFTFSSEKNVIFIILDSFGSQAFQDILNENTRVSNSFSDFIWYDNAVGKYPQTYYTVPYLLSDLGYDQSKKFSEYLEYEYCNHNVITVLEENGYRVEMTRNLKGMPGFPRVDCYNRSYPSSNSLLDIEASYELLRVVPFRFFPHIIKPYVIYIPFIGLSGEDGHYDLAINRKLKDGFCVSGKEPRIKIIHLLAGHAPYYYDQNLEISTNISFKQQALGSLHIVENLLFRLKNARIYNDTAIIVAADHGNSNALDPFQMRVLLLIKPFNLSSKTLVINHSPVQTGQIPYTIVDFLDLSNEQFNQNESILVSSHDHRIIYTYSERFQSEIIPGYDGPALYEWVVYGNSNNLSSYRKTGKILSPNSHVGEGSTYHIDEVIDFSELGNFINYKRDGWSWPESSYTWTDGNTASLVLEIQNPPLQGYLILNATPYLAGNITKQSLWIYINGHLLTEHIEMDRMVWKTYNLTIPPEYLINGTNTITFELPDAINANGRKLGIAVNSLTIHK